jgi:hypothetical protein
MAISTGSIAVSPEAGARNGIAARSGTTARSWNRRIEKAD